MKKLQTSEAAKVVGGWFITGNLIDVCEDHYTTVIDPDGTKTCQHVHNCSDKFGSFSSKVVRNVDSWYCSNY